MRNINDKKYKMSIEVGEKNDYINKNIIIDYTGFMYFYVDNIKNFIMVLNIFIKLS